MTAEQKQFADSTARAIMSRISVPMDTRGFGGKYEGILLGNDALRKIDALIRAVLSDEAVNRGLPESAFSGNDSDKRIEAALKK